MANKKADKFFKDLMWTTVPAIITKRLVNSTINNRISIIIQIIYILVSTGFKRDIILENYI
jgi:hypothetical protein